MSEEPARVEVASPGRAGEAARALIRRTRQVTRRKFPAEEKIRIVLEGIRGEVAVSELCRREGIHPTIYYKWLKDFMEAGKGRMRGDTKRRQERPWLDLRTEVRVKPDSARVATRRDVPLQRADLHAPAIDSFL